MTALELPLVCARDTRQSTRTRLQQLSDALSPPQVLYRTYLDLTLKGVPLMPSKPSNQRTRPRYNQMNFDRVGYSLLESFRHQALVLLQMGEIGKTQWTTINGIISNRLAETEVASHAPGVVQELRRAI